MSENTPPQDPTPEEAKKAAKKAYMRAWELAHRDDPKRIAQQRAAKRKWREAHPPTPPTPEQREAASARSKARYAANPELFKARTKAYAAANPEKIATYQRRHYAEHRDEKRAAASEYAKTDKARHAAAERRRRDRLGPRYMKNYNLIAKYGVSLADYDRMVAERGGLCDICKQKPSGKRHHSVLHIDHNHETGANRGLLCAPCNMSLGGFGDRVDLLRAAIGYLGRHGRTEQDRRTTDRQHAAQLHAEVQDP